MAGSGDVDNLDRVLNLLAKHSKFPTRLRVGDIECDLSPIIPPIGDETHNSDAGHLSPEEQEREAKELYEATMYGSSEGRDLS